MTEATTIQALRDLKEKFPVGSKVRHETAKGEKSYGTVIGHRAEGVMPWAIIKFARPTVQANGYYNLEITPITDEEFNVAVLNQKKIQAFKETGIIPTNQEMPAPIKTEFHQINQEEAWLVEAKQRDINGLNEMIREDVERLKVLYALSDRGESVDQVYSDELLDRITAVKKIRQERLETIGI